MRFKNQFFLGLVGGVVVGFVGVLGHEHGHVHEEEEVPLHERVWSQESVEELERKWSFEVCSFVLYFCWVLEQDKMR